MKRFKTVIKMPPHAKGTTESDSQKRTTVKDLAASADNKINSLGAAVDKKQDDLTSSGKGTIKMVGSFRSATEAESVDKQTAVVSGELDKKKADLSGSFERRAGVVPTLNLGNSSEKSTSSQKSVTVPALTTKLSGTGPSLQSAVPGVPAGSIYTNQSLSNPTFTSPIVKTDLTGAPTGHASSGTPLTSAVSALHTALPSGQVSTSTTPSLPIGVSGTVPVLHTGLASGQVSSGAIPSLPIGVSGTVPVLHTTLPSGQVSSGAIPSLPVGVSATVPVLHTTLPSGQVSSGAIPSLPVGVSGTVPLLQANLPGSPTNADASKSFSKPTIPAINVPAISSGSASGAKMFFFCPPNLPKILLRLPYARHCTV
jgi:hypothetical protein